MKGKVCEVSLERREGSSYREGGREMRSWEGNEKLLPDDFSNPRISRDWLKFTQSSEFWSVTDKILDH